MAMRNKKIAGGSYKNYGGRKTKDYFFILVLLGFTVLTSERQGPDLTQERNKKQKLGLRGWTYMMSEIAVEREGKGKNTQELEAEKESYTCCQVAKCVVTQVTGREVYVLNR